MPADRNIVAALRELGHFANTHTPHFITSPALEPVESDADDFNADLMKLAAKVDAVIAAYGEYLQSNGILSRGDVEDCFRLQLQGALEGNATYLITSGVEDRLCYVADQIADHKRDLAREDA